ncbi:MAG: leucine-rich repeat protein [Clostridiales bacterium]|nr:leucine-rich repeat protein [Clostridiales bacterium]
MRSFLKKIASVLAAAFIISTFSMIVSAGNTLLDSGSVSNVTDNGHYAYTWEYYEGNTLKIYPMSSFLYINLNDLNDTVSHNISVNSVALNVVIDISQYSVYSFMNIYGNITCPADTISITGYNDRDIYMVGIHDFPNLSTVNLKSGTSLSYLNISNCGITSVETVCNNASVEDMSISNCSFLKKVVIPSNVNYFELNNCASVASIEIPDTLEYIYVYESPNLSEMNIPENLKYCYLDKVGFSYFYIPSSLEDFRINSDLLEEVIIEEGRTTINDSMFRGCSSLNIVEIPEGVTTIEYRAFGFCDNLTRVLLPESLESIQSGAFIASGICDISIPEGVTSIEYATFRSCDRLSWVDIPTSVTSIDESAFDNCSGIEDVFYMGSRKQWDEITIYNGWDDKVSEKTIEDIFGNADIWFDDLSMIKTQPVDFYGPYGSTAVFSFETYNEISQYQWQIYVNESWRNILVDSATTSQLSFVVTEYEPVAGKPIRCIAVDYSGFTEVTDEVYVVLIDKVNITKQPEDLTCEPGEMATFSVEAEGEGLKYQWQVYKNGAWTNCSIKDGAKTPVLTLEAKESRNETRYQCIITDKYGYSYGSGDAILYVRKALTILTQPENCSGAPGDTAIFTVVAEGSGLKYQWQTFKNGSWTNCSINDGAKTDTLSLAIKSSRDGSKYQCVITDKNGDTVTTDTVTLTIGAPLKIVTQPEDYSGAAGETATFTVAAEGTGLKYQWQTLKNGSWTNCSINDGAKTTTLTLAIKDSRNGSKYQCVITDKNGATVTTETVTLTVKKEVIIVTEPSDYCAYVLGETATFTIEAEGEGLKYQWQVLKNGAWTNCSINDGAKTKTLSLEVKSSRDGSEYRCVVTDKYGNSAESITVTLTIAKTLEPTDPNDLPPIEINPVNATAAEIDFTAADCVDITEIVEVAEVVEAAEVIETVSEIETVTDID